MNFLRTALRERSARKNTRLILAADVTTRRRLLELAEEVGPEILALKLHIDIIEDFHPDLTLQLQDIAEKHGFFLFEDRKFADIGKIVSSQYTGGLYRIAHWAHLVTVHVFPGPGVLNGLIEGLAQANIPQKERGFLLIAEMSSAGQLGDSRFCTQALNLAQSYGDSVVGFIAQRRLTEHSPGDKNHDWLTFTPGVHPFSQGDSLGQNYISPEEAFRSRGADAIIVGRAITQASNPKEVARSLRIPRHVASDTTLIL
jgi:orotidine 5'-phosphate decarboxylase subfamily 1